MLCTCTLSDAAFLSWSGHQAPISTSKQQEQHDVCSELVGSAHYTTCNSSIINPFSVQIVRALNKRWHKDCFVCVSCSQGPVTPPFAELNGTRTRDKRYLVSLYMHIYMQLACILVVVRNKVSCERESCSVHFTTRLGS